MILGMRKMTLVALEADREAVLDALAWSGGCELIGTYPFDKTQSSGADAADRRAALGRERAELSALLRFFEERREVFEKDRPERRRDKPLFACRREIGFGRLREIGTRGEDAAAEILRLSERRARRTRLLAEIAEKEGFCERLAPFAVFPEPLETLTETKTVLFFLGTVSASAEECVALAKEFPDCAFRVYGEREPFVLFSACPRDRAESLRARLTAFGFSSCPQEERGVPAKTLSRLRGDCARARLELIALDEEIATGTDSVLLEDWFDHLGAELERAAAAEDFRYTQKTFVCNAWVPENATDLLDEALHSVAPTCSVSFSLPELCDQPPTLAKNKKAVAPFEAVTNMYSVPSPYERDPNLFVMIFFLIFFGIMLSDAGYGLILAAGTYLLLRFVKMETPMRRMVFILCLGGVSTVFWGILFGGWFGITLSPDSPSAVLRFLNRLKWFGPLEQPLLMLGLCMGLGAVQILASMGLRFAALVREGKPLDAVLDVGVWFLFFAGLGILSLSAFPALFALKMPGLGVMLGALCLLVLTQGRREKGLLRKLGKGLASLYGLVGYLSDLLSYARLFGLGLATGVIALVMNTLAVMLFQNPWTAALGVIVAAGGHLFNLAINVLGAYVHDCRLQYIEFFSRFYTGGGRVFRPMLSELKYNVIR